MQNRQTVPACPARSAIISQLTLFLVMVSILELGWNPDWLESHFVPDAVVVSDLCPINTDRVHRSGRVRDGGIEQPCRECLRNDRIPNAGTGRRQEPLCLPQFFADRPARPLAARPVTI
jgi:hypothetical protein